MPVSCKEVRAAGAPAEEYVATIDVDGVEGSIVVRRFTSRRYSVPASNIGDTELLRHVHDRSPEEANDLWMRIAVTAISAVRNHLGETHATHLEICRHDR